jgi:hypothetical protein
MNGENPINKSINSLNSYSLTKSNRGYFREDYVNSKPKLYPAFVLNYESGLAKYQLGKFLYNEIDSVEKNTAKQINRCLQIKKILRAKASSSKNKVFKPNSDYSAGIKKMRLEDGIIRENKFNDESFNEEVEREMKGKAYESVFYEKRMDYERNLEKKIELNNMGDI